MLDHLHNNAYAHNGIADPDELTELFEALGGLSKATAHVIHSLLHIYDSLYVLYKEQSGWQLDFKHLEETITGLIPDPVQRRCFFRMLNKRADLFMVKDAGNMYILPYTITDEALPHKLRQYSHQDRAQILPSFRAQIKDGKTNAPNGKTSLLPNVV
jgi:hypothetical protein